MQPPPNSVVKQIFSFFVGEIQTERIVQSDLYKQTILKNEERGMNPQQSDEMEDSKWMWIQELVTVLLYYEILTRRQRKENRRYF